MKAGKAAPPQDDATSKPAEQPDTAAAAAAAAPEPIKASTADPPDMVRIKRKYNFAGKVHTEEKLVPRDSAEAKPLPRVPRAHLHVPHAPRAPAGLPLGL